MTFMALRAVAEGHLGSSTSLLLQR